MLRNFVKKPTLSGGDKNQSNDGQEDNSLFCVRKAAKNFDAFGQQIPTPMGSHTEKDEETAPLVKK